MIVGEWFHSDICRPPRARSRHALAMAQLRPLTANDGPEWLRIYESVASEGRWIGGELPVDPVRALEGIDKYVNKPNAVMFLAVADDVAVGFINVTIDEEAVAELGMAIVDGYRSQGIGSSMMEVAIEWAREAGARRLRLEVFPHNERALGLYRKFGFTVTERRVGAHRRRTGEVWDGLVLERDVCSAGS